MQDTLAGHLCLGTPHWLGWDISRTAEHSGDFLPQPPPSHSLFPAVASALGSEGPPSLFLLLPPSSKHLSWWGSGGGETPWHLVLRGPKTTQGIKKYWKRVHIIRLQIHLYKRFVYKDVPDSCFENYVHVNHRGVMLKCQFWSSRSGRRCVSKKLWGSTKAAGPRTPFWVARRWNVYMHHWVSPPCPELWEDDWGDLSSRVKPLANSWVWPRRNTRGQEEEEVRGFYCSGDYSLRGCYRLAVSLYQSS